jgi:hypothetical protein
VQGWGVQEAWCSIGQAAAEERLEQPLCLRVPHDAICSQCITRMRMIHAMPCCRY